MIKSRNFKIYQAIIHGILICVTLTMVLPLVLLFISSISSESSLIVRAIHLFRRNLSLDAYKYIWQNKDTVFRAYVITIIVTIAGTAVNLALSSAIALH